MVWGMEEGRVWYGGQVGMEEGRVWYGRQVGMEEGRVWYGGQVGIEGGRVRCGEEVPSINEGMGSSWLPPLLKALNIYPPLSCAHISAALAATPRACASLLP